MVLQLIPLTDRRAFMNTYGIYKSCMYKPTVEKFRKKVDFLLNDDTVRIYGCLADSNMKGVIIISLSDTGDAKLIGIAVDANVQRCGIGSYMIRSVVDKLELRSIYAETDGDAVGFYCKLGFHITELLEKFGGESVVRYGCKRFF